MFESLQTDIALANPSSPTVAFPLKMKTTKMNGMPMPPRRPNKFYASESFIKNARLSNNILDEPAPKAKQKTSLASTENEQLERLLQNPTAAEILKQLE